MQSQQGHPGTVCVSGRQLLGFHPSVVIGPGAANRAEETVAWHAVAQWNAVPAKTHIYPQITQIHADY